MSTDAFIDGRAVVELAPQSKTFIAIKREKPAAHQQTQEAATALHLINMLLAAVDAYRLEHG